MQAIGFDLGDTLIYYDGIAGGSFKEHFRLALGKVCAELEIEANDGLLRQGERILSKYNTRDHAREHEVTDGGIFAELLAAWQVNEARVPLAIDTFFAYFQRGSRAFEETIAVMHRLKQKGCRIGVLTDVPYGMNRTLVLRDIAPIREYVDVVITSVEAGFRKPRPEGYFMLAEKLGALPQQMLYVGNEEKDVAGANRSGMTSVFIDRHHTGADWRQQVTIRRLNELEALLN